MVDRLAGNGDERGFVVVSSERSSGWSEATGAGDAVPSYPLFLAPRIDAHAVPEYERRSTGPLRSYKFLWYKCTGSLGWADYRLLLVPLTHDGLSVTDIGVCTYPGYQPRRLVRIPFTDPDRTLPAPLLPLRSSSSSTSTSTTTSSSLGGPAGVCQPPTRRLRY
eukprot:2391906-Rhodomonas_salina.1